jgi:hypothetical protein
MLHIFSLLILFRCTQNGSLSLLLYEKSFCCDDRRPADFCQGKKGHPSSPAFRIMLRLICSIFCEIILKMFRIRQSTAITGEIKPC